MGQRPRTKPGPHREPAQSWHFPHGPCWGFIIAPAPERGLCPTRAWPCSLQAIHSCKYWATCLGVCVPEDPCSWVGTGLDTGTIGGGEWRRKTGFPSLGARPPGALAGVTHWARPPGAAAGARSVTWSVNQIVNRIVNLWPSSPSSCTFPPLPTMLSSAPSTHRRPECTHGSPEIHLELASDSGGGGEQEESASGLWEKRGGIHGQSQSHADKQAVTKLWGSPFPGPSLASGLSLPGPWPQPLSSEPTPLSHPSAPPWLPCVLSKSPSLASWRPSLAELVLPAFLTPTALLYTGDFQFSLHALLPSLHLD